MRDNRSFDTDAHVLRSFPPRLVCAGQAQR